MIAHLQNILSRLRRYWTKHVQEFSTLYDYRVDEECISQIEFTSNYIKGSDWASLTARICLTKSVMPERTEFEPRSPMLKFTLYLDDDIIELIGEVFRCGKIYSGSSWLFGASEVGQVIHMRLLDIPLIVTRKKIEGCQQ